MEPELIADYACVTGEGPLWHPDEQRVYWADIPKGRLFRYDPATGKHEQCYEGPDAIGGYTIQTDGSLLLFMAKGAIKSWREGKLTTIIDGIPGEEESRFNDVIADPLGGVFCGTMPGPAGLGHLYRLGTDGKITKLMDGIDVSNGFGFTPDRKQLYYTISHPKRIFVFDYNQTTGALTDQRVFLDTTLEAGVPDGMAVDAEGYVWSARWDGWRLTRYTPDGREVQRIQFPVKKVSSVTFGGADYRDMYVTTAGGHDKTENGAGAGALFRLRLGIQGQPAYRSRVGL